MIEKLPRTRLTLCSMSIRFPFLCSAILSLFLQSAHADEAISLWNGKNLDEWTADVSSKSLSDQDEKQGKKKSPFQTRDGILVITGKPYGHLYTREIYRDYTLTVEYRYPKKKGNCGVMIHSSTPRYINNLFPRCIEVQLLADRAGDFIPIGEDITGTDGVSKPALIGKPKNSYRPRLGLMAEEPIGKWNELVIHCQSDSIVVLVNGKLVNVGTRSSVSEGKIALQSEGSLIEFRKIELKKLRMQKKNQGIPVKTPTVKRRSTR